MKDLTIANHLCSLHAVARFYPGLWTHDPEMMSVAIMMDPIGSRSVSQSMNDIGAPAQGTARYGQMVIMVELIQHLWRVRQLQDPAAVSQTFAMSNKPYRDVWSGQLAATTKFVVSLEARLGIMIQAKVGVLPCSLSPGVLLTSRTGAIYFDPGLSKVALLRVAPGMQAPYAFTQRV